MRLSTGQLVGVLGDMAQRAATGASREADIAYARRVDALGEIEWEVVGSYQAGLFRVVLPPTWGDALGA